MDLAQGPLIDQRALLSQTGRAASVARLASWQHAVATETHEVRDYRCASRVGLMRLVGIDFRFGEEGRPPQPALQTRFSGLALQLWGWGLAAGADELLILHCC